MAGLACIDKSDKSEGLGYEPADLTVHPPPPDLPKVSLLFSYRCLLSCVPKTNVLKGKPVLFGVIHVKRPNNVFCQIIHSNQMLLNLTFLDNNE